MKRRHFLQGVGGALMAIPFLPSLEGIASAQMCGAVPRCFFAIGTEHGGIWGANMYPAESVLTGSQTYAGRTVRFGDLPSNPGSDGVTVLSPMCRARGLTPGLVSKFNILRGLDIPYRISHHSGGYLGNFAGTVGQTLFGVDARAHQTATIDQVIAWSSSFYGPEDLDAKMTQRSFHVGNGAMSWNFASPSTRSGRVGTQPSHSRNQGLFDFLFDPGSAYNGIDAFIIDRVKGNYDRLKRNPRLSRGDLMRLEQHVERMFEIERKLRVVQSLSTMNLRPIEDSDDQYRNPSFGSDPTRNQAYCGLMNDVIVAAFAAGVSRVGTWHQSVKFADELINDWHGQVAHGGFGADVAQRWTLGWNQGTFEHVMVDLVAKMDQVTVFDGTTLLDNSLVMLVQEAGQLTHHTGVVSYPVVTAGSAGGYFRTGMYVDYSNKDVVFDDLQELSQGNAAIQRESPGLYYNQFLGSALQSMGLSPSEYENFADFFSEEPTKGFGIHAVDADRASDYLSAKAALGEPLGVLT
jgi:hypothetical protein